MGGLHASDLIIVAGRPSMAKRRSPPTSRITSRKPTRRDPDSEVAVDGAVVGFFSLEMSAEQLATRIISEQALYPFGAHPPLPHRVEEFDRIVEVSQELQNLPLYIDQTAASPWLSSPRARGA